MLNYKKTEACALTWDCYSILLHCIHFTILAFCFILLPVECWGNFVFKFIFPPKCFIYDLSLPQPCPLKITPMIFCFSQRMFKCTFLLPHIPFLSFCHSQNILTLSPNLFCFTYVCCHCMCSNFTVKLLELCVGWRWETARERSEWEREIEEIQERKGVETQNQKMQNDGTVFLPTFSCWIIK